MKDFFSQQWVLLSGIFAALLVSAFCQLIITYYMLQLVKASENPRENDSKILTNWIEEYSRERQKISNITVFIDKKLQQLCIGKYKMVWIKHLSGQALMLSIFLAGVGACKGIIEGQTLGQVLPFYIISLFGMYLNFSLSGIMDLEGKKKQIRMNLSDFLENKGVSLENMFEPETEKIKEQEKNYFGENEDRELREMIREILT